MYFHPVWPYCANVFNPHEWGGGNEDSTNIITLEFTRVVLAIGVFAIGVELPKAYMLKHWKSLFFLLVPVMTWGWFVSAGLIYALIPGLNFVSSLAVAACLTPTDPILAAAVVGGKWANKHVPTHIRHLLAAESGCNDGAAYPFLFIALYLMLDQPDVGHAIRDWFLRLWLYQIILGIVIGAVLGFSFRHLMKFCQKHNLIDRHSYVAQYVSLAMLTVGVTVLLGSDDLLAAFSCGTAFAWDGFFNRQTEESVFSSVIDLLFNIAAFIYVGAWMPFDAFNNADTTLTVWRLIVIAILVFILRRLPVMILLYKWIPDVKTLREAIFSGHFGPIGIGAVFISTLANITISDTDYYTSQQVQVLSEAIQPIVAFMVLCSIILHGLSIPSFSLGRRVHSVSRTWSRHTSMSQPEWTNQIRVVERGADNIVINRDVDLNGMERGELGDGESKVTGSGSDTRAPSMTVKDMDEDRESIHSEKREKVMEAQPDATPDEGPTEIEWLEPHRRVIERRQSPGDDVDVEVVEDEGSQHRSLRAQIKQSLGLLHGLKETADDMETKAGETVTAKVEEIELKVKDALSTHQTHDSSIAGPSGSPNGDDDEAWASDSDARDSDHESHTAKKRPKARAGRLQRTSSGRPRHQRRLSIRRSNIPPSIEVPTQPPISSSGSGTPTPPDGTDTELQTRGRGFSNHTRSETLPHSFASHKSLVSEASRRLSEDTWPEGRRHRHRRPPMAEGSILRSDRGDSSPRNARVSNIKMMYSSPPTRDVSPSRSVRFINEHGNDLEIKNKVSFDLGKSSPGGKS
ncbi:hypothetical protein H0H92_000594 [Tricholoma furcatifolium]|nr:hypothetical protein H0H92_000594 [Tricholoma furcatifolium]